MTENLNLEKHPGILPDMQENWARHVENLISGDPGDDRESNLSLLAQVSTMIKALDAGMTPHEVLKLVQPTTSFVAMGPILSNIVVFSVRGEEFRLWWNEWHDRVDPSDIPSIPVEQMTDQQRDVWNRRWMLPVRSEDGSQQVDDDGRPKLARQPAIFTPWLVNIVGTTVCFQGPFDPSEPMTKSPKYMESVKAYYKKIKGEAAATA